MTKKELRQKILTLRRKQKTAIVLKKSDKISKTIQQLNIFKNARTVLLYLALPDEVQTKNLILKFTKKKNFVAPVVSDKKKLILKKISPAQKTSINKYNIHEPQPNSKEYSPAEIDLALIPGIAFDKSGNRLGFGKGYYDRLLKKLTCPCIGLAFQKQIIKKIPLDEHDRPVDMIITEKNTIIAKNYH